MSMRLGSPAEWQLAHASTPPSMLAEVVRRAVGTRIVRVDRIVEGYSNEVYRVRCAEEQDVVVRILRFDDEDLATKSAGEAWAIEKARAAAVPAPEILLLDTVQIGGSEFPVMVQRTVPGRPLAEVIDRLSERQRHDVLTETGGLIARLNGIQVDQDCCWQRPRLHYLASRYAARDKVLAAGFSAPRFDGMLDLLEEYVRDFPNEHWVLCHGDLSPQHIFVTGDISDGAAVRVSGIIDFGDWQPGAPVHDLAVLRVREPRLDLPPVLAGYGAPADGTYRRRLDLHTLVIALDSLEFGVGENDRACIERSGHLVRTLTADLED